MKKPSPPESIHVSGARTHNLRGVDCHFPMGQLTVVTGVSGSGKSSLAFDTLFAEGQRRYVESLSAYARQFIARMPRPDVDLISHLPPAIALEQKNSVRNARSTVGTATEVNDFLRLLFAKAGRVVCPACNIEARRWTAQSAAAEVLAWPEGARVLILAESKLEKAAALRPTVAQMRRQGYTRAVAGGGTFDLDDEAAVAALEKGVAAADNVLGVVVDRVALRESERTRLGEALAAAFRAGHGRAVARTTAGEEKRFSESLACAGCGRAFKAPEARLFSFSNPLGACPRCEGFGRITGIDWDKVVPDPRLTLAQRCIAPFNGETNKQLYDWIKTFKFGIPFDKPFKDLSEEHRRIVLHGSGEWWGVVGFFKWLEEKKYKVQNRVTLARYRGYTECDACGGARLAPDALVVRIGGRTIADVCRSAIIDLGAWFAGLELAPMEREAAARPLAEIRSRLDYLLEVGLGYLTLDRQTRTLSGGEFQRINLATALGSALTDTLYVLDEPTVGLHPRDTARLVTILQRLTGLGNTVVVVEHDLDVMRAADHLVDMGPQAGEHGGRVVFEGRLDGLQKDGGESMTARFLAPARTTTRPRRREPSGYLRVAGAHENNLDYLSVDFPLGVLCCVTGVSGSGKSTLVKACLWGNYRRGEGDASVESGKIVRLEGVEQVADILLIDQEPIGRSSRSNAATYLKAFDGIRKLLAGTHLARARGVTTRDFSFNVSGGRCETCEGTGRQTIDMQFLADVEVVCEKCEGRRFQERVLDIEWNGMNVSRILALTVAESIAGFAAHRDILAGLQPLADVGLGYLRLGQPTNTLSGGEAQRLKLAGFLAEATRGSRAMLILDEPTTGLHPADLEVLLAVLRRLVDRGFSIVVIEHNLELIRQADWIIDLGPEGGRDGGRIVCEGTPETVAACRASHTGAALAR